MTKFAPETTLVKKNRHLSNDYHALTLGPLSRAGKCRPGHFVHVQLPETEVYFRRPMSVAAINPETDEMEFIFKVFGRGTAILSRFCKGMEINIMGPLGNTFTMPRKNETSLLVAGGIGFPPLLYLATEMVRRGFDPGAIEFFYGGRSSEDILERNRIKKLGVNLRPVTDDGSFGQKGLVTEAVDRHIIEHPKKNYRIFGCGPDPMLKAADALGLRHRIPGQLSLEAPMPCGIGICLGCVVPLRKGGHARVCQEGPVFEIGEVLL
jgi:dihydroorotate dehydrogenase electron transfer subunit